LVVIWNYICDARTFECQIYNGVLYYELRDKFLFFISWTIPGLLPAWDSKYLRYCDQATCSTAD